MSWWTTLLGRPAAQSPAAFLAELAAAPWAMEPHRLAALFSQLAAAHVRARGARLSEREPDAPKSYATIDGVAHVGIVGPIAKSVPWFADCLGIAMCSTVDTHRALAAALADPAVRSIMLRIDSPGGTVAGVQELGDAIFAARATKPVNAYASDLAASGAYWLGSQAQRFSANATAELGSIGVYGVIMDESAAATAEGVKVHVVRSGPHKGAGVPGAPIDAEQLAAEQTIVDGLADIFIGAVARGRGLSVEAVRALATGQTWLAADAVAHGLLDAVESIDAAHGQATAVATTLVSAGGDDMATVAELEAQLASTKAELDASKAAQAAGAAQIEAMRVSLAEVTKAQRTAMVDAAVAQGRVMPASRAAVLIAVDGFGADLAGAQTFLSSLPQVTHPTPLGTVPPHKEPTSSLPADVEAAIKRRGHIDPAIVARSAEVDTWDVAGNAKLKSGAVVRLKDYLAGTAGAGGAA